MKISLLISLFICSFGTLAAESIPPAVKAFEKQGIKIIKKIQIPGVSEAWLGEFQDAGVTIFLTPDGKHAISGYLYDEKGENISEEIFRKELYIPEGRRVWKKMLEAKPLLEGNASAPRKVIVFADPYCPYCKQFWSAAQPWVSSGKVQLNTLMVAFLNPHSGRTATAILNAEDPVIAWKDYELSGGKKIPKFTENTPKETFQLLQYHQRLMDQMGAQATPAIYYLNDRNELEQYIGMPDEKKLKEILGPLTQ